MNAPLVSTGCSAPATAKSLHSGSTKLAALTHVRVTNSQRRHDGDREMGTDATIPARRTPRAGPTLASARWRPQARRGKGSSQAARPRPRDRAQRPRRRPSGSGSWRATRSSAASPGGSNPIGRRPRRSSRRAPCSTSQSARRIAWRPTRCSLASTLGFWRPRGAPRRRGGPRRGAPGHRTAGGRVDHRRLRHRHHVLCRCRGRPRGGAGHGRYRGGAARGPGGRHPFLRHGRRRLDRPGRVPGDAGEERIERAGSGLCDAPSAAWAGPPAGAGTPELHTVGEGPTAGSWPSQGCATTCP